MADGTVPDHDCDLLIIGAGPSGLYAAYYAGFRRLSVVIIDSLTALGGQLAALYPEKLIYDVAGFPEIKGQDLVDGLVEQAGSADPVYLLGQRAETLEHDDEGVTVTTAEGITVRAKAVIVTGGIGTFTPRPLPDAQRFEGRGLRYFVPRLADLADRDVLIVGGGDSALDWAMALEPLASSVTLIHRRTSFRGHEASVDKLMASSVQVKTPFEVAEIHGDGSIDGVSVKHNESNEIERLHVTEVVAALGFTADLGTIASWGLELSHRHIVVDSAMRTNLARVLAAGDIVEYEGKVRLISVGFGEAATAVNNAAPIIDAAAKVFPGHSSGG